MVPLCGRDCLSERNTINLQSGAKTWERIALPRLSQGRVEEWREQGQQEIAAR